MTGQWRVKESLPLSADRMFFYRVPTLQVGRPLDFCLDGDGSLWESYGKCLLKYDPRKAEAELMTPEALADGRGNCLAWLGEEVLFFLAQSNDYLALNPRTGQSRRCPLPSKPDGDVRDVWFCLEVAGKVLAFDRGLNGGVMVLDRVGAMPRLIECPFGDPETVDGLLLRDGRVMIPTAGQMAILMFDPVRELFTQEIKSDYFVSFTWGCMFWKDIAYIADTSGGRLLRCDTRTGRWLDPIPTPEYGTLYGYIGQGLQIGRRGYFNLNTWRGQEGLDRKTHKLRTPLGYRTNTVDGQPMRFLDRFLVFDAESGQFDCLVSPPQPDGVAELCYSKYQDGKVFITGHVIPSPPGQPVAYGPGDYCVWQSFPASREERTR